MTLSAGIISETIDSFRFRANIKGIASKGAVTKYDPKTTPQLVEHYAGLGYTNTQIAKKLKICRASLYIWQKKYPAFEKAFLAAKAIVDDKVEQKLFRRAMGFSYTETTRELNKFGQLVVTKKVRKQHAPEVIAMIFWLKNRQPDLWRDRKDVKHSGAVKLEFDSVLYEAVHGDGIGREGGNGKSHAVPAIMDN